MLDDVVELGLYVKHGLFAHSATAKEIEHAAGDASRLFLHGFACFCEPNEGLTGVYFAFFACHDAFALHTLDERSYGVGFERQSFGDIVDGKIVAFPKHHQHEILGIGYAQTLKVWPIGLDDEAACRIEAKAELVVEFELIVGHSGCALKG